MRQKIILLFYLLIFFALGSAAGFYLPKILSDILYPLVYKEQISKYSRQYQLPRNIIAAVIYVESGFNPHAHSSAGARGIMQIMPSTGASIAKMLGESDYDLEKLWDPETNIRYGTAYLRSLYDAYEQNWDLALAAYNGGGAAEVLRATGNRNLIPRETNSFIRKVSSMHEAYDKLYGPDWQYEGRSVLTIDPFHEIISKLYSNLKENLAKVMTGSE